MDTAKEIAHGIEMDIPELKVIGGTKAMIVCVAGKPQNTVISINFFLDGYIVYYHLY